MDVNQIIQGDALAVLKSLPDGIVQTCCTSPPYFGLRDYQTATWEGGDPGCTHRVGNQVQDNKAPGAIQAGVRPGVDASRCKLCGATRIDQQIGLEETPDAYVSKLVEVFREVRRVLRDDGVLWLNIGDSYAGSWGNYAPRGIKGEQRPQTEEGKRWERKAYGDTSFLPPTSRAREMGLKPKDLIGIPWMVAFALRADGWYLRSDIIWNKPTAMPESVTDRPTKAHEYLFLLSKNERYFYDAESIREENSPTSAGNRKVFRGNGVYTNNQSFNNSSAVPVTMVSGMANEWTGRNKRTVWTVASQPYSEAHFACVDEETESLTPQGWKRQDELQDGELIAVYNPDEHVVIWQPATFHRYDYDGELVTIEKRDASQRLTPNHRCFIKRRIGGTAVVRADQLKPGMQIPLAAPLNPGKERSIGQSLAALLGWYITEGHDRYPGHICIYQSETANPAKVATIRHLLTEVNATFTEHRRERTWKGRASNEIVFRVSGDIAFQLQQLAPCKKLCPSMLHLLPTEAQALLEALIDGDGHRRDDGRWCIVQKDKECIDAMQMLALRLGYRAHISPRDEGGYTLYITKGEWLTLRGTNGTHTPIPTEHYKGVVWCPSVPTGFWLARRDGKPFITGNTFPPKLIEPCILAGTSPRACEVCGSPWQRVTEPTGHVNKRETAHVPNNTPTKIDSTGWAPTRQSTDQWQPTCTCSNEGTGKCIVLDPFIGAGTTALVAIQHGRNYLGIDLNVSYVQLAEKRIATVQQNLWTSGSEAIAV